ncbi:type I-G CRISPR-associated protein Csb2 [Brevibacterium sp. UBA7493]|uniref:type I-G CRISPR-associated protein Csb2 n=1 Tax=Brevibacterium sp. UBA7493 TaxID=1946121 RepID=UPI002580829A|nr:type I-U CRISPR-associated protein Csb2 [Brevibacterium sp. UBA7493]
MGVFEVTITLPLGSYTGHRADGSQDPFPDPARVFSALVQAAYTGTSATDDGGVSRPSPASAAALEWLETHPPDALHLPQVLPLSSAPPTAYRREGLIRKEVGRVVDKTSGKATDDGVAVSGAFGLAWNTVPPSEIAEAIDALCQDVSHIGESLSLAVLEAHLTKEEGAALAPSWLRDKTAGRFTPGGMRVRVAVAGRHSELQKFHESQMARKKIPLRRDNHKMSEDSVIFKPPTECLREIRFTRPHRPQSDLPWGNALVIAVDSIAAHADGERGDRRSDVIPEHERVDWCVSLHRGLAKRIAGPAPALITGRYPEGFPKPANRLAIQYLDPTLMAATASPGAAGAAGAFVLLIPSDAASDDLLLLHKALYGLREVRSRHGVARVRPQDLEVSCERFWKPPAAGMARIHQTVPAMVADVRKQGSSWTLADCVLVAIGYTWRDRLDFTPKSHPSRQRHRALLTYVSEHLDPRVLSTHRLPVDGRRYVHRLPKEVPAEPFTALVDMRSVLPPQALAAIGQSRHLGGGLLAPVDMPESLLAGFAAFTKESH